MGKELSGLSRIGQVHRGEVDPRIGYQSLGPGGVGFSILLILDVKADGWVRESLVVFEQAKEALIYSIRARA